MRSTPPKRQPTRRQGLAKTVFLTGLTAVTALAFIAVIPAQSGFTARVANAQNLFGSGTSFATIKDDTGTTLCSSQPTNGHVDSTAVWACSGMPSPTTITGTLQNKTLTITNGGTTAFKDALISGGDCYPRALANSSASSNMLQLRYGTTSNQPGPGSLTGAAALTLDGTTGTATGLTLQTNPQTYTVAAWFKTSTKRGVIAQFSSSPNGTVATGADRTLYLDTAGNLAFDTMIGGSTANIKTAKSTGVNYADGAWHMAVGVASAATNSSIALYIDGALATTTAITGPVTSNANDGYWRVGSGSLTGRTSVGSGYFAGSISNLATFPAALTATQISALYAKTSQGTYASGVSGYGANNFWPLGVESLNKNILPAGATNPCGHARPYVDDVVIPYVTLRGFTGTTIPTPTPGSTQTLKFGLATNSSYVNYDAGLHLEYTVTITEDGFDQQFNWAPLVSIMM